MDEAFRWGILGCGRIAEAFADGLSALDDQALVAVASREQSRAKSFARRVSANAPLLPRAYGDYESLCADEAVDAIYVATPHSHHAAHATLVLEHGKPLLCEKPFTVNAREAEDVLALAGARGVFCMEAMWTRFRPAMHRLLELLDQGAIGRPEMLHASFGFRGDFDPQRRHFDLSLAGGALLDVGVYCVSLALIVFGGAVRSRASLAAIGTTGVDERSAYLLGFDGGALAVLSSAIATETSHDARIDGSEGSILVPDFWRPDRLLVTRRPSSKTEQSASEQATIEERFEEPGNGYQWQAVEVARCVRAGLLESPLRTHDDTMRVMRELDALRADWGLRYPADDGSRS